MTDDEKKAKKAQLEAEHLRQIRESAEDGEAEDQLLMAIYYKNGDYGLKQDYKQAAKWYRKAAEQGDADALYGLAMFYADGLGVKRDWQQAKQYFTEAALAVESISDDTTLDARDAIKMLNESEYSDLVCFSEEFHKRCPKKRPVYDMVAARELPSWDYEKYFTVPQDYAEAIKEYRQIARQNDPYALLRLGLCYADGLGVEKDWEQAKQYFAKAVLADCKGDDIFTLDAKEAYKLLFECDCDEVDSFADEFREALRKVRLIYQGKGY